MEHRSLKREHQNDAEDTESTPQKRGKVNQEQKEDGKIEYKIQRRSPSLVNRPPSHQRKTNDEISSQRPFGAEKTSMSFPEKIMRILSFPEFADGIRWNPEGTEFCIFPDAFAETVLEPHFQGTKFTSFTRKLNRFSFKRILDEDRYPKGTFAYHHEYFQRGRDDLIKLMEIDSDKKQRRLSVPIPVAFDNNSTVWEEGKDENRSSRLDNFSSQLAGIASSPTSAAGLPVASTVAYFPTQQELNRLQALRFRQQQLTMSQQTSFPEIRSTFNPLLQASLPSSLYSQSSQVPMSDTALFQDISYRRQEQLSQALQQLPAQRQLPQGQPSIDPRQQSVDPRLLYFLLTRQQQQQQQGRNPSGLP